ncbi:UNVERIFIED_CONTAM: hypothetical protein Slati_1151900 [Sesamum latifolium]|uniref:Chromo domain-containing protein n=1 Tax=Sesamum latifolium TaxID=2727402 RepID=A0AAW2XCL6_9LAMI
MLPEEILQTRVLWRNGKLCQEALVKWVGTKIEEATWELLSPLLKKYPNLLQQVDVGSLLSRLESFIIDEAPLGLEDKANFEEVSTDMSSSSPSVEAHSCKLKQRIKNPIWLKDYV